MSTQIKDGNGALVTAGDTDFGGVKAFWQFIRGIQSPAVVVNFSVTAPSDSSVTAFASHAPEDSIMVQADPANTVEVKVGSVAGAAASGITLAPGQSIAGLRVDDTAKLALSVGVGGSGAIVHVLGG